MEFVWMKCAGVEKPAKVPVTAVPHWEGNGWERTDAPEKPPRPTRTYLPAVVVTTQQAVDAASETLAAPLPPATKPPVKSKTAKAPAERKED